MFIERTFILDAPLQRAWDFLNQPQEVGNCLPGCHTVEVVEPGKYKASVGLKVGPIKAGFDVQVETSEERPPTYAAYTMRGADKEGGSKISADCTLKLSEFAGQRTEITYTSKVNIVGKLGKFAGGIMQKFADGINDQFIAAITERIRQLESELKDKATEEKSAPGGFLAYIKSMVGKFLDVFRRNR